MFTKSDSPEKLRLILPSPVGFDLIETPLFKDVSANLAKLEKGLVEKVGFDEFKISLGLFIN